MKDQPCKVLHYVLIAQLFVCRCVHRDLYVFFGFFLMFCVSICQKEGEKKSIFCMFSGEKFTVF